MRWLASLGIALALTVSVSASAMSAGQDGLTPDTAFDLATHSSGTLAGSGAGAFAYYSFAYPGDGTEATMTINFSPTETPVANAIGVSLWQDGMKIATMNGVGGFPGANSVRFSSDSSSPVLAQVYSYYAATPVSFSLSLSGVPLAAVTPVPATTPTPSGQGSQAASVPGDGTAARPYSLSQPASGTLGSNRYGSFVYYSADYPGGDVPYTVNVRFSPVGDDTGNAVFLTVYQNGTQLASDRGSKTDVLGQFGVTFSSSQAGPVLIQVANYNFSKTIQYDISLAH